MGRRRLFHRRPCRAGGQCHRDCVSRTRSPASTQARTSKRAVDSHESFRVITARRLVVALLLGIGAGSGLSAQGPVDVVDLIGKNRSALTGVFPGAGVIIKDWHG